MVPLGEHMLRRPAKHSRRWLPGEWKNLALRSIRPTYWYADESAAASTGPAAAPPSSPTHSRAEMASAVAVQRVAALGACGTSGEPASERSGAPVGALRRRRRCRHAPACRILRVRTGDACSLSFSSPPCLPQRRAARPSSSACRPWRGCRCAASGPCAPWRWPTRRRSARRSSAGRARCADSVHCVLCRPAPLPVPLAWGAQPLTGDEQLAAGKAQRAPASQESPRRAALHPPSLSCMCRPGTGQGGQGAERDGQAGGRAGEGGLGRAGRAPAARGRQGELAARGVIVAVPAVMLLVAGGARLGGQAGRSGRPGPGCPGPRAPARPLRTARLHCLVARRPSWWALKLGLNPTPHTVRPAGQAGGRGGGAAVHCRRRHEPRGPAEEGAGVGGWLAGLCASACWLGGACWQEPRGPAEGGGASLSYD